MDAILFSAQPSMVTIDDAIRHLADHPELYWEVGFAINKSPFTFPIAGFIHICGGRVEYKATITDFLPFSPDHYENPGIADRVKPEPWRQEWHENIKGVRDYRWKTAIVMTEIVPFSFNTTDFHKIDGTPVTLAPRSYTRVLLPNTTAHTETQRPQPVTQAATSEMSLSERHFEDILIQQLDSIEPGLKLVSRQLSTPAGRLDLLCRDADGNYVVVELKRTRGTDQVVGQIARYIGWVKENYQTDNVRGIVVVASKDALLTYAARAMPNLQVKEFKLTIK